jgi:hypothetical protein
MGRSGTGSPITHTHRHQEQFTAVSGEQVLKSLADVVVNATALFDGGQQSKRSFRR